MCASYLEKGSERCGFRKLWMCALLLLVAATLLIPAAGKVSAGPASLASASSLDQDRPGLARPVGDDALRAYPDRFYPYGSTGQGRYQVHHGVEFVNPVGTLVLAAEDGTVVVAGEDDLTPWGRHPLYYGRLIVLRHERRYWNQALYTLYGHLDQIWVHLGQKVRRGEAIGTVGSTGVAIGPHLHFEVRVGRNAFSHTRNPELWLEPLPGHGTIVGRVVLDGQLVPGTLVTFHPIERPERYWREAWTYPNVPREQIRADEQWDENYVLGDVPGGEYLVYARVNGRLLTRRVNVKEGETAYVLMTACATTCDPPSAPFTR